jgi:hypothetical protein
MNLSLSDIAPYLLVAFILVINIALWASFKNSETRGQLDMLRKAGRTLRNPFEKEDAALKELSQKVNALKTDREDIQDSEKSE